MSLDGLANVLRQYNCSYLRTLVLFAVVALDGKDRNNLITSFLNKKSK